MEELEDHFVKLLRKCIDNGMKLPFIVCAISPNGSVLVTRINEGRGPDTLAQHFEDHAFKTPVNIMVVDHVGKAARVVITGGNPEMNNTVIIGLIAFAAILAGGVRWREGQRALAKASPDGRDKKPCIRFDGGGRHGFGAGAWPAYF